MAEYEADVFIYCNNPECEYSPDCAECVTGHDGKTHYWTCPDCGKEYEFEIEFEPEVTGFREKQS